MFSVWFSYLQGLIEFVISTGFIIGPPIGGGLHEVRVLMCVCVCVQVQCVCISLNSQCQASAINASKGWL